MLILFYYHLRIKQKYSLCKSGLRYVETRLDSESELTQAKGDL
jgi:hypothetical protein